MKNIKKIILGIMVTCSALSAIPANAAEWIKEENQKGQYVWYYYDNGYVTNDWVYYNDEWYYLDDSGVMLTGNPTYKMTLGGYILDKGYLINGQRYWFDTDGKMIKRTWGYGAPRYVRRWIDADGHMKFE